MRPSSDSFRERFSWHYANHVLTDTHLPVFSGGEEVSSLDGPLALFGHQKSLTESIRALTTTPAVPKREAGVVSVNGLAPQEAGDTPVTARDALIFATELDDAQLIVVIFPGGSDPALSNRRFTKPQEALCTGPADQLHHLLCDFENPQLHVYRLRVCKR